MVDQTGENSKINLRGGLSISVAQINQIQKSINRLMEIVPAQYILLVDTSGQLVTTAGNKNMIDSSVLGSLIAADLAASQEIARLTGEFQEYQMILREGDRTNIIISEAGKHLAFLVLFTRETPIGWARKLIQNAAKEIGVLVSQPVNTTQEERISTTEGNLPSLFNDALDEIWKD